MTFSHLPRALVRTTAPSKQFIRRVAHASRKPLHASRRPPVTLNRRSIRWASTSSSSRTWGQWLRGGLVRVGLAAGAVYFYYTSPVFAPRSDLHALQPQTLAPAPIPEDAPTLESLAEERKTRRAKEEEQQLATSAQQTQSADDSPSPVDPAQAEDESGQAGAFNPETGEINWDCPCLGGMAHGPCGENFKEAFSCFVFSKEEPKGMDCIEKFKGMQDCFREHPDVYGDELELDDEEGGGAAENAVGEQQTAKEGQTTMEGQTVMEWKKQQSEEQSPEAEQPEAQKAVEQQSEERQPNRGPSEAKAAKQSPVKADPKSNLPESPKSATKSDVPSGNAQSGDSTK